MGNLFSLNKVAQKPPGHMEAADAAFVWFEEAKNDFEKAFSPPLDRSTTEEKSVTRLFRSVLEGDLLTLEHILGLEKVDINAIRDGGTPLMVAAFLGYGEIIEALLSKGADPNIMESGQTVFKEALEHYIETPSKDFVEVIYSIIEQLVPLHRDSKLNPVDKELLAGLYESSPDGHALFDCSLANVRKVLQASSSNEEMLCHDLPPELNAESEEGGETPSTIASQSISEEEVVAERRVVIEEKFRVKCNTAFKPTSGLDELYQDEKGGGRVFQSVIEEAKKREESAREAEREQARKAEQRKFMMTFHRW